MTTTNRQPCPVCDGEGYVGGLIVGDDIVDEVCHTCHGRGTVPTAEAE